VQAARRYGVRGLPTFIVFDGQGRPVQTVVGIPDRTKIVAQTTQLLQSK
jgi:thioredoxin-related protein